MLQTQTRTHTQKKEGEKRGRGGHLGTICDLNPGCVFLPCASAVWEGQTVWFVALGFEGFVGLELEGVCCGARPAGGAAGVCGRGGERPEDLSPHLTAPASSPHLTAPASWACRLSPRLNGHACKLAGAARRGAASAPRVNAGGRRTTGHYSWELESPAPNRQRGGPGVEGAGTLDCARCHEGRCGTGVAQACASSEVAACVQELASKVFAGGLGVKGNRRSGSSRRVDGASRRRVRATVRVLLFKLFPDEDAAALARSATGSGRHQRCESEQSHCRVTRLAPRSLTRFHCKAHW
eukprot:3182917-Rhodomonas_salina.1